VRSGTPAEKAGLQNGDVITAIDGAAVTNSSQLSAAIEAKSPATR
jgi:putative serine protease PepD